MRRFYAAIFTVFALLFLAATVSAQQALVTDAGKKALNALSVKQNAAYNAAHQKALSLAAKNGWPVRRRLKNGSIISLQGLNGLGFPVYIKTNDNIISAATTQTNTVQPGGSLNLNLSGSSSFLDNKLAIWDGGAVYAAHQEFNGKTITINTSQAILDHSTHVAGTMIAKGVYPPAKGMAFNAATLASYDFDNDITTITAAAPNLLLSNHSYGDEAGWDTDDNGNWVWYGIPGDTVDYTFGIYNSRTQAFDQIAYNAPYYLVVESAGNARGYSGPAIGGTYYGYESATNSTLILKTHTATDMISTQQGYDGISSTGNAKDILTVGAVGPLPYGPANSSDVAMTYFSSYGPTDDGRVKPDIVGMGLNVLSCGVTNPQDYIVLSGTSMSAPNVTGSLYLLQEYYAKLNSGSFMHAATLKGLVCATAFDAGNPGPDYRYGWGLLNMKKAAQAITDNGTKSLLKEASLAQGQTQTYSVTASGDGPVIATICWTDPPGAATADGTVNDPAIKLINDLDVRVSDGTTTFMPWVLDPTHPSAPATTGDNIRDNVEQVYLANAVPGRAYTITVSQKGTLLSGPQAYSLIATGIGGSAYCASGPTSSADSRINNVALSNINNTPPAGCTTYSGYTNLTAQIEQGKTYPLSLTVGTCGNNFNKVAKVFIDWNGDGNFNGAGELVATTGVINGTGTYTVNITVPTTVIPGNYSLMRVVLTETSDTSTVKACGSYGKGETEDYRVQFLQTSTDAGVTAITDPDTAGSCAGTSQVTVTVKNFGAETIINVPVTVSIKAADGTITTIKGIDTDSIPPLATDNFTLGSNFNFQAGAVYTIIAGTTLSGDVITTNNSDTSNVIINTATAISALNANYCDESSQYILSGSGDGELFWYKNMGDNVPVAFGSPVNTSVTPINNTFYAGLNDFSGTVGPVTKNVFSAGGYNQFTPAVLVHANAPVIIQSARLYVGNSGSINFTVSNNNGETLSSTTINAIATRTTPAPGAQDDDPADTGKVYNLNLLLPAAGDYIITANFDNAATLYRSNGGVTGYPFTIGDIFSIAGNTATSTGADTAYYKGFYYYFYNMTVKSAGCAGAARQAVQVVRPVITQNGTMLSSNFASGNQWYFNGAIIAGATGQTYLPKVSGNYKLLVTLASGCTDTSANYVFVLLPNTENGNDISLAEYPIPANNILNVLFTTSTASDLTMSLINEVGRTTYSSKQTVAAGNFSTIINVQNQPPGPYVLKLVLGKKVYANKIIIVR
jgi:hypothetical protein